MVDDNLDTDLSAQDQDDAGQVDDTQVDDKSADQADDQQPTKPFNEEQEQYIGSWLGRIVAKQIDDKVVPLIKSSSPEPPVVPSDAQAKFNETLQSKIFEGDVSGALGMYLDVRETAKANLTQNQKVQIDQKLTSFSEEPYYKDIFTEMKQIAHTLAAEGVPPDYAATHAYQKAKADHLEAKVTGKPASGGLGVLPNGKRIDKKTPKLPPEFKAAAARDIGQGLFKDEQDYIAHLSPKIRKQYGI